MQREHNKHFKTELMLIYNNLRVYKHAKQNLREKPPTPSRYSITTFHH